MCKNCILKSASARTFKISLTRNQQNVNKLLVVNLLHKISLNSMTHNFSKMNLRVTRHSNKLCIPQYSVSHSIVLMVFLCRIFRKLVAFLFQLSFFFQVKLTTIFHSVNGTLHFDYILEYQYFFVVFYYFDKFTTP